VTWRFRISLIVIEPLVQEEKWVEALDRLPSWTPPRCRTLVISPHPDDETLGAGGLIKALVDSGVDVSVIAITDGENAYEGETGWGPVREKEQGRALMALGVGPQKIHRLRLTDSGLSKCVDELYTELLCLVEPDMHLIAPWVGDFHPDHEACGQVARRVADLVGASLTYYFFWTWHRGTPSTLDGLDLVSFALTPEQVSAKREALLCHCSQLEHSSGDPILGGDLLAPMGRSYEVYLPS
jgi:LmbE family N-acetylglucosaminyl deacetylase